MAIVSPQGEKQNPAYRLAGHPRFLRELVAKTQAVIGPKWQDHD
jgi:hypothetical protein